MDERRCLEVLRAHNEWRRYKGVDDGAPEMLPPKLVGQAIDHAIATIERGRWIPCNERLPEHYEHVEVYPPYADRTYNFYANRDGGTNGVKAGNWYHNDSEGYDWKMAPTHWRRPLPDPQPDGQEG